MPANKVSVTARVYDAVGVVKVELWLDGGLSDTKTVAPFQWWINTTGWRPGVVHPVVCKAYDAAGNVRGSNTLSLHK